MLTIFTIPRAFDGDARERQRTALRSWRALGVDVLVFGDDAGVAEEAAALGARHVPGIATTDLGTPVLADAFERARALATTPLLLYANADIVFLPDLLDAARALAGRRFLAVGRRIDARLDGELDFEAARHGPLDSPFAIDWFLYPRELEWGMPAFAVGRPGWDNWLIARARALRIPVVDATAAVTAIHQAHGYGHVPQATGRAWEGPEADRNRELAGGGERLCILDATHVLRDGRLRRALAPPYLRRRAFLLGRRHALVGRAVTAAARARRRARA